MKTVQSDQKRKCHLQKERTINSKYYMALLVRSKEEILKKRPQMKKNKVLFHQNNAPCHKSIAKMAKLHELHFELLPHPPYSTDLASSDYYLLADLKRMLLGKRFGSNEEVEYILRPKINRFTKKASKCQRSVGTNVSLLKETMLINEVEFCLKVILLVILRTY